MDNSLKSNYINSLTPMRGIAALWVVLFHIDVSIFYRDLGGLLPRASTGILSQGYLWVDFFFLLSGFIITHVYGSQLSKGISKKKIGVFLWARFTRLYPLHFFTLFVLFIGISIVPLFNPDIIDDSWETYFSYDALPGNIFLLNAMNTYHFLSWNITSWSIGAEWWVYVTAITLIPLMLNRKSAMLFAISSVAFIGLGLLVYLHPNKNLDITWDYGFLRCLFEFSIGISLYKIYQFSRGRSWLKNDSIPVLLLLIIGIAFHFKMNDLFLIPVFSLLILSVAYNQSRLSLFLNKPVLKFLGDISYSLYLVHSLWFVVFWFGFPQWKMTRGLDIMPVRMRIIYVLLFLTLTILSSWATYNFVEVPSRKWLRNRLK